MTVPTHGNDLREPRPVVATLAVGFVLLALAALVAVPALIQWRVSTLREDIVASEPARTLVASLQLSLVHAAVLASGGPASEGGPDPTVNGRDNSGTRRILDELDPLTVQLGPEVRRRFETVLEANDRLPVWIEAEPGEAVHLPSFLLPDDRAAFEELVAAVSALDAEILEGTARVRGEIAEAERLGLRVIVLLGALALLAAGATAILWKRLKHYAERAESGRVQAERQFQETEESRREAVAAVAEARLADEARGHLIRGISHDVKNPLGAARGFADLLEMGVKAPLVPGQEPLVEGVKRSVDGALAMIEDLLDLARTESEGFAIESVEADLVATVASAVEDHLPGAESAGHTLRHSASIRPLLVETDPDRVRQVLGNLISNAIKYTPEPGEIDVVIGLASSSEPLGEGEWVTIRVSDSGPGIPPEHREAIFDEFTRLDHEGSASGHGLGLAIARRLARMLGGELTVADNLPTGASFTFWLPRNGRPDRVEDDA